MLRRPEQLLRRRQLHNLACIHHRHPIANPRHNPEIMRHKNHPEPMFPLQILQQPQILRLNRNIQRSRRLIRNQHPRLRRQRNRPHNPLPHPPAHLMRIVPRPRFRRRYPHPPQQPLHPLPQTLPRQTQMIMRPLPHLLPHIKHRIQRSHRILQHHRHLPTPHPLHLPPRQPQQIPPPQPHLPTHNPPRRLRHQPQQRQTSNALSRPRLPYQPQSLPRLQRKTHPIHCLNHPPPRIKKGPQLPHLQPPARTGVSNARQTRSRRIVRSRQSKHNPRKIGASPALVNSDLRHPMSFVGAEN